MSAGCLAGKVAVVTGAGGGIGRESALLMAAEGARVVVNDTGGAADGSGSDAGVAERVAQEIRASGGEAVSSHETVADPRDAARIVERALDAFGRLDAVVNNAGILRDRAFHELESDDFKAVVDVHLLGSYNVSRAAATQFVRQGEGAYVHMTSSSALIGNYAQANYSAAKMGVVGLSRSIALDMWRYGVRSNCLAPFAWSRMMAAEPADPEDTADRRWWAERLRTLHPSTVAPLVVFLASHLSEGITGQIFGIRGNEVFIFSQPRPLRSIHRSDGWTPQSLADHVRPAFTSSLCPLERSADVFRREPT